VPYRRVVVSIGKGLHQSVERDRNSTWVGNIIKNNVTNNSCGFKCEAADILYRILYGFINKICMADTKIRRLNSVREPSSGLSDHDVAEVCVQGRFGCVREMRR